MFYKLTGQNRLQAAVQLSQQTELYSGWKVLSCTAPNYTTEIGNIFTVLW